MCPVYLCAPLVLAGLLAAEAGLCPHSSGGSSQCHGGEAEETSLLSHRAGLGQTAAVSRPPCRDGSRTLRASDGFDVGYWVAYVKRARGTLFILPGYSATAGQFVKWFAPGKIGGRYNVISMDYRGFGLSTGVYTATLAPDAMTYSGYRMSRIGADAHEIMMKERLNPETVVLAGHSYGVYITYQLISFFNPPFRGLVVLDAPPKIMNGVGPMAADPTWPGNLSVFNLTAADEQFAQWRMYNATGVEIPPLECSGSALPNTYYYPGVYASYAELFRAFMDPRPRAAVNAVRQFMCYNSTCLAAWGEGTKCYSEINGKLNALQMWSDYTQDFTDTVNLVRTQKYPVFVYGGKSSLVSSEAMVWTYNAMHAPEKVKDKLLIFGTGVGVHVPWLANPAAHLFYSNLTDWLECL